MKRLFFVSTILLAFLSVLASPSVSAQDTPSPCTDAEVAAVITQAVASLQSAQSLSAAEALPVTLDAQAALAAINAKCAAVSTADGSRTNPIAFGEYVQFDKGKFRITAIQDPYVSENLIGVDPGQRAVMLSLEYICEIADPNESCRTLDAFPSALVLVGGQVQESGIVMDMRSDNQNWSGQEAFAGNTLSGVALMALPETALIESLRVLISYEQYYFKP